MNAELFTLEVETIIATEVQRVSPSEFQFRFTANPGRDYAIERSSNLTSWTILQTNRAAISTVTFTDTNPAPAASFYRIRRLAN